MSQAPLPPQPPYAQPPYAQPGAPAVGHAVVVSPQPGNGMGVAGFVTSLIGLLTCGLLSPLGLLFSLIGLAKRPRGLAVAGTVLGGVGSVFFLLTGFAMVVGALGLSKAAEAGTAVVAGQRAYQLIEQHRADQGRLPADAKGTSLLASVTDLWGTPLVYRRTGETYKVVSLGKDKTEGTADDISFTEAELRRPPAATPADDQVADADGDTDGQ